MVEIKAGFLRTMFVCPNHRPKFRSGSKTRHYPANFRQSRLRKSQICVSRRQGARSSAGKEGQCREYWLVGAEAGNFPDSPAAVESRGRRICDRPRQCNFSQSPSRRHRYFIPDTKRQTFRLHTIFSESF